MSIWEEVLGGLMPTPLRLEADRLPVSFASLVDLQLEVGGEDCP